MFFGHFHLNFNRIDWKLPIFTKRPHEVLIELHAIPGMFVFIIIVESDRTEMHIEPINPTLFKEDSLVSALLVVLCRSLNEDVAMPCHNIDEVVVMLSVANDEREGIHVKAR